MKVKASSLRLCRDRDLGHVLGHVLYLDLDRVHDHDLGLQERRILRRRKRSRRR